MNAKWELSDELVALLEKLCAGDITPEQFDRLSNIIVSDSPSRRFYVGYLNMHANLPRVLHASDRSAENQPGDISASTLPSLPNTHYPLSTNFVGGPVFSYMVATVVLCLMLLGAWAYKVSHISTSSPATAKTERTIPPAPSFVGRITGMKDCQWSDPDTQTILGAAVLMDRQYALASGLMEITYTSGARVILEGPCTYKVDSVGGFLERGKLTARVKSKGSGFRVQGSEHSPLFAVRTPTATVTDLGTEFGVEVAVNGDTVSYVFEGKVVVKARVREVGDSGVRGSEKRPATAVAGDVEGDVVQLTAGESVLVKKDETETVRFTHPTQTPKFVRRLAAPPDTRAEEAYMRAVLADKPLAYWPLNEPAGSRRFSDLSGNGFDGAAMGKVQAGRPGPLPGQSQAVELKGDGYIDIGRQDRFAMENGFTVEAWVFLDDCWQEESRLHIRVISVTSSENRYQQSGWSVGFKALKIGERPFCCFGPHGYQTGSTALKEAGVPVSRWLHVALVYDADNVATLYLNGKRRASAIDGRPVKLGPTWVTIGFGPTLGGEYWQGRLAHVAVYRSVLAGRQIDNHFKSSVFNQADQSVQIRGKEAAD